MITRWPPRSRRTSTSALAAIGVELAHHVVEQHQRRRAALGGERLALGQQQRQQREALLALRAVGAQLAARRAAATRSSRCGPWPVKPRSRSPSTRSASSAASSSRVGRSRARPVAQLGVAVEAELLRASAAKRAGRQRRPPRRGRRISATPWRGELARPRLASDSRDARAGADRAPAARCAARAPARRRGAWRARAGHSAATTWSRCARRSAGAPLTSSRRSGRKTLTSGRAVDVEQALDRRAVDPQALRLAGLRSRPRARARRPSASASTSTRPRAAPKRTTSRSLVVRHERAGAAEVQRLEQVRLAGAVGPVTRPSAPRPSAHLGRRRRSGSRARRGG